MNRRAFLTRTFSAAVALAAAPYLPAIEFVAPRPDPFALVQALIANAIQAHDDALERAFFTTGDLPFSIAPLFVEPTSSSPF
jgi:hypothetical protein